MPRRTIERIRERILLGKYDMTIHALEEMAEDNLDILDVEHAILTGGSPKLRRPILGEQYTWLKESQSTP